jgi:hypothetical protein
LTITKEQQPHYHGRPQRRARGAHEQINSEINKEILIIVLKISNCSLLIYSEINKQINERKTN